MGIWHRLRTGENAQGEPALAPNAGKCNARLRSSLPALCKMHHSEKIMSPGKARCGCCCSAVQQGERPLSVLHTRTRAAAAGFLQRPIEWFGLKGA